MVAAAIVRSALAAQGMCMRKHGRRVRVFSVVAEKGGRGKERLRIPANEWVGPTAPESAVMHDMALSAVAEVTHFLPAIPQSFVVYRKHEPS